MRLTDKERAMISDLYLYDRIISLPLAHKYYFGNEFPKLKKMRNTTYKRLNKLCERKVLKKIPFEVKTENEYIYMLDQVGLFCVLQALNLDDNLYDGNRNIIKKNHKTLAELELNRTSYSHQLATVYARLATKRYLDNFQIEDIVGYSKLFKDNSKMPDLFLHNNATNICFEIDMGTENATIFSNYMQRYISQIYDYYRLQKELKTVTIIVLLTNKTRIPISRECVIYTSEEDKQKEQLVANHNRYLNRMEKEKRKKKILLLNVLEEILKKHANVYVYELLEYAHSDTSHIFEEHHNYLDLFYQRLEELSSSRNVSNSQLITKDTLKIGSHTLYANAFYSTSILNNLNNEIPCQLIFYDYTHDNLQAISRCISNIKAQSYITGQYFYNIFIIETSNQMKEIDSFIENTKVFYIAYKDLSKPNLMSYILGYNREDNNICKYTIPLTSREV